MKATARIFAVIVALLAIVVLGGTFFIVDETQQVVITQFGEPKGDPITTPGLKVKLPFIQNANYFDKRFLEWDGVTNEIPTRDKRFIHVDTFARWRISDPLKYFQRLRTEIAAQSRLDDLIDGETRDVVADNDLIEVVRSTNRDFEETEEIGAIEPELVEAIKRGRANLAGDVLREVHVRAEGLGISIHDFQFKRISYVEDVRREVYSRMISERQRIAEQFRSEGAGESARINGQKERELKEITSEAYRKAQEIKGEADAKAADIYASVYNRDPEFYRFFKSMEIFKETLDDETVLVLSTKGEFLRYLGETR